MNFVSFVHRLTVPHESNNHKARLLQPFSITLFVLLVLAVQLFLPKLVPVVLGYSASISAEKIIEFTNQKREENNLSSLKQDRILTEAALTKGADMFARNYWAHIAPDGTKPWYFFIQSGYQYRFAGENLARDFSKTEDIVVAWMNSPTHKDNILSPKYEDIGVAVVEGELDGVKTTVVVQLFGTKLTSSVASTFTQRASEETEQISTQPVLATTQENSNLSGLAEKLISPLLLNKTVSLAITSLFIGLILIDIVVIGRNSIARRSGRNFAHLVFLLMIGAAVLVVKSGLIV